MTYLRRVGPDNFWLKQFGQLKEFIAVASLDEDIITLRTVFGNGGLHFLHIVELAKGAGNVAEVVAHEPYIIVAR